MALTIRPAPGYTNPFTALIAPLSSAPPDGRDLHVGVYGPTSGSPPRRPPQATFFGILLLEIRAGSPAAQIQISMANVAGGGLRLYGPSRIDALGSNAVANVGVLCSALRALNALSPITGTITLSWLDPGSSAHNSIQFAVTANLATSPIATVTCTSVELIASSIASRHESIALTCQEDVAQLQISAPPAPSTAFSWGGPTPSAPIAKGHSTTVDLRFDANAALNRDARVVTVQAKSSGGRTSEIPLIAWCIPTLGKRDVAIVSVNADPPGPDLPNESITLKNMTTRALDLTGCTLHDEGNPPAWFATPHNRPMNRYYFRRGFTLPAGATVQLFTRAGTDTPTTLFWGKTQPVWDNDFDTAVLLNAAGDEVDSFAYAFALPGQRIPGQAKLLDAPMFVDQNIGFTSTSQTLEDGDFVVIQPDPSSRSWAGDLFIGDTGPGGDPNSVAPDDPSWPLPGAHKFALLAETDVPIEIGATTLMQVINRDSSLRPGFPLTLRINDNVPGGFLAWGGYSVRVRIFRK